MTTKLMYYDLLFFFSLDIQKRGGWRRGEGSSGIEAYYSHAMVEDPWKELEEKYKRTEEQSS